MAMPMPGEPAWTHLNRLVLLNNGTASSARGASYLIGSLPHEQGYPLRGALLQVKLDLQSPWQCRSNENTNDLLRRYFPKGMDLSAFSQAKLNEGAGRLNQRPRKTLVCETPIERYRQAVALTGESAAESGHHRSSMATPLPSGAMMSGSRTPSLCFAAIDNR